MLQMLAKLVDQSLQIVNHAKRDVRSFVMTWVMSGPSIVTVSMLHLNETMHC